MKTKRLLVALAAVLFAWVGAGSARAATWFVATNSPADGPGTDWTNAFHTI